VDTGCLLPAGVGDQLEYRIIIQNK